MYPERIGAPPAARGNDEKPQGATARGSEGKSLPLPISSVTVIAITSFVLGLDQLLFLLGVFHFRNARHSGVLPLLSGQPDLPVAPRTACRWRFPADRRAHKCRAPIFFVGRLRQRKTGRRWHGRRWSIIIRRHNGAPIFAPYRTVSHQR
jgi:hypothetical protein